MSMRNEETIAVPPQEEEESAVPVRRENIIERNKRKKKQKRKYDQLRVHQLNVKIRTLAVLYFVLLTVQLVISTAVSLIKVASNVDFTAGLETKGYAAIATAVLLIPTCLAAVLLCLPVFRVDGVKIAAIVANTVFASVFLLQHAAIMILHIGLKSYLTLLDWSCLMLFGLMIILDFVLLIADAFLLRLVDIRKSYEQPPEKSAVPTGTVAQLQPAIPTSPTRAIAPSPPPMFKQWEIAFEDIKQLTEIAAGGSGAIVYKGLWRGNIVAVKVFRYQTLTEGGHVDLTDFDKELQLLSTARHKNLVFFYGASLRAPRIALVTEYCDNGNLKQFLTKHGESVTWSDRVKLCIDIMRGLFYLHQIRVIHRDLKSDNILIDDDRHAKLTDFGISSKLDETSRTKNVGTGSYMAPEVTVGNKYDYSSDVYSFAIVMWEILTNDFSPYKGTKHRSIEIQVAMNPDFRPAIPEKKYSASQQLYIKLMQQCWKHEPAERPSDESIVETLVECSKLPSTQSATSLLSTDEQ